MCFGVEYCDPAEKQSYVSKKKQNLFPSVGPSLARNLTPSVSIFDIKINMLDYCKDGVRLRCDFTEESLDAVLSRKKRVTPPTPPIFDGETEAKLIALACSPPPPGRSGWTLRLLEEKVVELKIVDHASDNTIGRVLKKNWLKPHLKEQWVIRPPSTSSG